MVLSQYFGRVSGCSGKHAAVIRALVKRQGPVDIPQVAVQIQRRKATGLIGPEGPISRDKFLPGLKRRDRALPGHLYRSGQRHLMCQGRKSRNKEKYEPLSLHEAGEEYSNGVTPFKDFDNGLIFTLLNKFHPCKTITTFGILYNSIQSLSISSYFIYPNTRFYQTNRFPFEIKHGYF